MYGGPSSDVPAQVSVACCELGRGTQAVRNDAHVDQLQPPGESFGDMLRNPQRSGATKRRSSSITRATRTPTAASSSATYETSRLLFPSSRFCILVSFLSALPETAAFYHLPSTRNLGRRHAGNLAAFSSSGHSAQNQQDQSEPATENQ